MKIKFELNGHPIEVDENPRKKLSEFLRQNNYFSVKKGCGHGSCNSCTILVNDEPMLSCIIPLAKIINSKMPMTAKNMPCVKFSCGQFFPPISCGRFLNMTAKI